MNKFIKGEERTGRNLFPVAETVAETDRMKAGEFVVVQPLEIVEHPDDTKKTGGMIKFRVLSIDGTPGLKDSFEENEEVISFVPKTLFNDILKGKVPTTEPSFITYAGLRQGANKMARPYHVFTYAKVAGVEK